MTKALIGIMGIAAIATLVAAPSYAADMSPPPPAFKAPLPPAPTWSGCYLNAGVGYGVVDQRTSLITSPAPVNGPLGVGVTLDQGEYGWLGRFGGGCDYQLTGLGLSNWVIGAFGDYDASNINGFHTGEQFATIGLVSGRQTLNGSWQAGGRIGYLVTPGLLAFTDAGYSEASFSSVAYSNGAGVLDGLGIPGQTYGGWFLGGGTEYALNFSWLPIPGLFWRTEYRFSVFPTRNVPVISTATGAPFGAPNFEATRPYEQTIASSIVWRFNWWNPVAHW